MKCLEAREVEARSRARTLGVRVREIQRGREYSTRSQSDGSVVYLLRRGRDGWACTCLGYQHSGMCKHLGALERRSEREAWPFGTIARPAPIEQPEPTVEVDEPEWMSRGFKADPSVGLSILTGKGR